MAMSSRMEDCPNEIIEKIVTLLALEDIRNLRLTSRSLSSKCTQEHFKSFYRSRQVDVTTCSLTSFVEATRVGRLVCLVQDLTITGVVYNTKALEAKLRKGTKTVRQRHGPMFSSTEERCTDEELASAARDLQVLRQQRQEYDAMRESGRDVELLSEAFQNLVAHGKTGVLERLMLRIVVYRNDARERLAPGQGGAWKLVWNCAAETYSVVFAALNASGIGVDDLGMFDDDSSRRCSIARNELDIVDLEAPELAKTLSTLKGLSLRLSDRIIPETDRDLACTGDPDDGIEWSEQGRRDLEVLKAEASDERNFSGLAKLFCRCTKLRSLDLHYYRLSCYALQTDTWHSERLLQKTVEMIGSRTLTLTSCRLRGLTARGQDLLTLVRQAPIKRLVLENVMLAEGTFEAVFSYCTSREADMQRLLFDDLFEESLVYFGSEGSQPKFLTLCGTTGSNTLDREGDDVRRPIRYHFATERPLGSPQAYYWREKRRAEYGPP